jgi:spoIIIJ-associated protein
MVTAKQNMEDLVQETLAGLLQNIGVTFRKFKVAVDNKHPSGSVVYRIDIDSEESSTLIGYHGETIYALQHLLKSLIWRKTNENVFVVLDVDGYRKRQEESVLSLAMRKVEAARTSLETQVLPPMSPYFRRVIHMALATEEYNDIETESIGEGEHRTVTIKPKR